MLFMYCGRKGNNVHTFKPFFQEMNPQFWEDLKHFYKECSTAQHVPLNSQQHVPSPSMHCLPSLSDCDLKSNGRPEAPQPRSVRAARLIVLTFFSLSLLSPSPPPSLSLTPSLSLPFPLSPHCVCVCVWVCRERKRGVWRACDVSLFRNSLLLLLLWAPASWPSFWRFSCLCLQSWCRKAEITDEHHCLQLYMGSGYVNSGVHLWKLLTEPSPGFLFWYLNYM